MAGQQAVEREVAAQLLLGAHLDAADGQQPLHFLLREVARRLVAGQAIFVEAAQLGPRIEQHHVMPAHGQAMRAGQARRARAHHSHALARGCGALEQRRPRLGKEGIGGVALQRADLDRFVFIGVAHAGLLTQHLGGAHAGAHAAQRVGREDGARRAAVVVLGDAVDERGDVDARGTRRGAGCVVAVVAALRLDQRLRPGERRVRIAEIDGVVGQIQACGVNAAGTACGSVHQCSSGSCGVGFCTCWSTLRHPGCVRPVRRDGASLGTAPWRALVPADFGGFIVVLAVGCGPRFGGGAPLAVQFTNP